MMSSRLWMVKWSMLGSELFKKFNATIRAFSRPTGSALAVAMQKSVAEMTRILMILIILIIGESDYENLPAGGETPLTCQRADILCCLPLQKYIFFSIRQEVATIFLRVEC